MLDHYIIDHYKILNLTIPQWDSFIYGRRVCIEMCTESVNQKLETKHCTLEDLFSYFRMAQQKQN